MILNRTYRSVFRNIICFLSFWLLVSCSLKKVKNTPFPKDYAEIENNQYTNGYPKNRQPWVVFSDRSVNKINPTIKEDPFIVYKEAEFLSPFVVLKQKRGMFEVAEYKSDLINNGKLPKKKALKVLGWIPEEHLLLWTNSIKKTETGFASKAAVVVNHEDVISNSKNYIENDSVLVFSSPDLIDKVDKKVSIGSIVYIYKQSEDKSRMLIGKQSSATIDSLKSNIYGWVSKNVLSVWGERYAVKIAMKDSLNTGIKSLPILHDSLQQKYALNPKELNERGGIESIYPVNETDSLANQVKFFTNVFDYDKNKIYNVLGDPVYYRRYREILANNKKLNVVFVLDVSKNNRLYIPVAKSLLQELQLNFVNPSYFSSIKFGGVVYKQNNCGISPLHSILSSNYRDIALFFEDKIDQLSCFDSDVVQPVDKGLLSAAKMLTGSENETNLIVLIGTTADQNYQSQSAINALTRVNAKVIFFQTQSKSADAYNDFVLLGEKLVVNSAKNIAEIKKEKIVNQNDLLVNNNYNLTTGENGIYYLDYPKQSMTQGFVIFPKKGEAMQAGVLKSAIDTLLIQVTKDNQQIDSTLTKYFRSEIGVNNTRLNELYADKFLLANKLIPTPIASSLLNQNSSFLIDGAFSIENDSLSPITERGILLSELEYEQLRNFYTNVYKEVLTKGKANKKEKLNKYLAVVSESIPSLKKVSRNKLKKKSMSELAKLTTGLQLRENILMGMTTKELIKSKEIETQTIVDYFENFKEQAGKLGVSKGNPAIRIEHQGQVFYWLNEDFVPTLEASKAETIE